MAKSGRRKASESLYNKEDLIKMVIEWTITGVNRAKQIESINSLGYGSDYAYYIFREAKPFINDILKDIGKDLLEETIAELRKMKLEADADGDKNLALQIQKEINKIANLGNTTDITSGGKPIENISVIKMVEVIKNKSEEDE